MVSQVQVRPYLRMSDNFLALAASLSMAVVFLCCIALKLATLTELPDVQKRLSVRNQEVFVIPSAMVTTMLFLGVVGSLLIAAFIFAQQLAEERMRLWRENRASQARMWRSKKTGKEVTFAGPSRRPISTCFKAMSGTADRIRSTW